MKKVKKCRKNSRYTVGATYKNIDTETLEQKIGKETDGHGMCMFDDYAEDADWEFNTFEAALKAFKILHRCPQVEEVSLIRIKK